ncbi:MAG: GntR family transcriptional regulator [Paracoccaceae bacterium]|nr:GntR family transcriptional regulator [Paracoccaceae bacterium]MDG1738663.1 GntR family transcriptional regulator [Paracoccaceae bacterium]MDG2258095.1 GntR family transcriptional regulator [Paracoccaceae bacterium]
MDTQPKASPPAHEIVYGKLREHILFGDLIPGQAITIQGLTAMLDAGMTPVREALRRLISEGALVFNGNRRVSVPVLSTENVNELLFGRQAIEPQLVIMATQNATPADLDAIEAIDIALDEAIEIGDVKGYLRKNYEFHRALYDLANAPILASLADTMYLRFGPSLRVISGRLGTQSLPDLHKACLSAMRAGDAHAAANAIKQDVVSGMELMKRNLTESHP